MTGIEKPLELGHELNALVTTRLWVEEDDERPGAARRDGLHDERPRPVRRARLAFLDAADGTFLAGRLAKARLEVVTPRQFHDPRRRHRYVAVNTCVTSQQQQQHQLIFISFVTFTANKYEL